MNPVEMENLVELHGDAVYRFCARLTGSRQEADDLFQRTFLRAMELAHRIDRERSPLGFLLAIAARAHRRDGAKAARRQRIAPQAAAGEDGEPPDAPSSFCLEDEAGDRELREAVRAEVLALPIKLREPVAMLYAGGLTVEEAARALGLPPGTVKSRLYKARKLIREGLEAKGYGSQEV